MSDAARIRAFRHAIEDAVADQLEPEAWGTFLSTPSLPDVWDLNFLRVERGRRGAASLAREADRLQPHLFHRKVTVERTDERMTRAFRELGWSAEDHLVMVLRREPDRLVDDSMVHQVSQRELNAVRERLNEEEYGDPALARRLTETKRRVTRAVRVRNLAAVVRGRIAAYCELRSDGRTAQIEDVNTLDAYRGRGLGRALVQHALLRARRSHDLVFLEALADDWPHRLYRKLGFDVIARRSLFLRHPHLLTALRVETPRLELRLATRAELEELARVAQAGIHAPDTMPFAVAWTDGASSPRFVDEFAAFHEAALAGWKRTDWTLNLVAFHDGRPIGTQGMSARGFGRRRAVETGSWLGAKWQNRGLGTEMRAAVLELAFKGLRAEVAESGAIAGNDRSLAVSRKLGYRETGTRTVAPRGEPLVEHVVRRRRRGWRSPVRVEIRGLDALRPQFGA
jgi:RimJ/RimL family protein N-acetyltransferase/ribosomal protein S18 acetylase RimI-like enzyme